MRIGTSDEGLPPIALDAAGAFFAHHVHAGARSVRESSAHWSGEPRKAAIRRRLHLRFPFGKRLPESCASPSSTSGALARVLRRADQPARLVYRRLQGRKTRGRMGKIHFGEVGPVLAIALEGGEQGMPGKPLQKQVQAPPGKNQAEKFHQQSPIDNDKGRLEHPVERTRFERPNQPRGEKIVPTARPRAISSKYDGNEMTEELSRVCFTLFSSSRTPLKERTLSAKNSARNWVFPRSPGAQHIQQPQAPEGTQGPEARSRRHQGERQKG